jgi:hypothetical protein
MSRAAPKLAGIQGDLYALRLGGDLRVIVHENNLTITVLDVVLRSQVEGMRRLHRQGQSVAE